MKYKEKAGGDGSSIKQDFAKKQNDFLRIRGHMVNLSCHSCLNYVLPYALLKFLLYNLSSVLILCFCSWLINFQRKKTCLIYLTPSTVSWHSSIQMNFLEWRSGEWKFKPRSLNG